MTPDLLDRLKVDRRRIRSEVALHAARALIIEPEQFEPLTAVDALLSIPYVTPERAAELLSAAKVYPLRRLSRVGDDRRAALARQLAQFAKAGAA